MLTTEKHENAIRLYRIGQFEEASRILTEALGEGTTSELANDWGATELACGRPDRAEQGFSQALKLDAANVEAAENLGVLLGESGRFAEAFPVLEQAIRCADTTQRARLISLLAEYRTREAARATSRMQSVLHDACANFETVCAAAKPTTQPAIFARVPSNILKRSTEDCVVYKPDFVHVPYPVAELSGRRWERREDHAIGSGSGAMMRWRTVTSRLYALLTHFPWGGKVAVSVNGALRNVVDLYSYGKYTEPLEVFRAEATSAVEVELRVIGRNPLSRGEQLASFGFLIGREVSCEPQRVETGEGFVAIQKQQIVNWLQSIKNRGLTLEEVTEQRKGAYTLRVGEAMAFMRRGGRVLDVGCGYVFKEILRDVILARDIEYWLQDIDPDVCGGNRSLFEEFRLATDHIFCGDNTNLPYPDGFFHGVLSSHCLEHSKDLERTFIELSRIILPGGTLVFAVPRNWDRAEEHIYAPLEGGWEAFTERHGFRVISSNLGCYYREGGENDLLVIATKQ